METILTTGLTHKYRKSRHNRTKRSTTRQCKYI